MTDIEFEKLKTDIELAIMYLNSLQRKYRSETGKDYVPDLVLNGNNS